MKKYKITVSDPSKRDIKGLVFYIRNNLNQPQIAYKLAEKIRTDIRSLDSLPTRFPIASEELWAKKGLRKAVFGNYIIAYSVDEEALTVTIIRVLHAKSDWEKIL